jgi:hypothetical protein
MIIIWLCIYIHMLYCIVDLFYIMYCCIEYLKFWQWWLSDYVCILICYIVLLTCSISEADASMDFVELWMNEWTLSTGVKRLIVFKWISLKQAVRMWTCICCLKLEFWQQFSGITISWDRSCSVHGCCADFGYSHQCQGCVASGNGLGTWWMHLGPHIGALNSSIQCSQ